MRANCRPGFLLRCLTNISPPADRERERERGGVGEGRRVGGRESDREKKEKGAKLRTYPRFFGAIS